MPRGRQGMADSTLGWSPGDFPIIEEQLALQRLYGMRAAMAGKVEYTAGLHLYVILMTLYQS